MALYMYECILVPTMQGKMVAYGNIQYLRANRVNSEKLLEFKKDDQSNGESFQKHV